jgi:hypothetical protein
MLSNSVVPNVNRGNTRNVDQTPTYGFNPWVIDGSLTYVADSFPFYKGTFPIKASGAYMNNPAAPSSADNYGWNAGLTLGKSGKRGTWELSYNYRWLGANAWYEEFVDDDFGAFYSELNAPPNSGLGIGYGGGSNVKGHIVRFAYSATDSLTLSVKWYLADLIHPFPAGSDSQMSHLLVDAIWKF